MRNTSVLRYGALIFAACLVSATISCNGDPVSPTRNPKGTPILIEELTPNTLEARAGTYIEPAPAIRLKDALTGSPLAGVTVKFLARDGAGSVQNPVTKTDASGIATAGSWQVGTRPQRAFLTVVAGDQRSSFTVLIKPGVPAYVMFNRATRVALSGETVEGPVILIADIFGNPIPEIPVALAIVAGGGSLENFQSLTDIGGRVSVGQWRLGSTPGENTISVTVDGIEPASFTVHALDAALLRRYTLDGVRAEGVPSPQIPNQGPTSLQQAGVVKGSLGITSFDQCLCRTEAGYFVMNIEYKDPTSEPTRIAGEYAIQPPQLVLHGTEIRDVRVDDGRIEVRIVRDTGDWLWEETWIFGPEPAP